MGGSKQSGSGTTTSTQTNEPWAEQKPYLLEGFQAARNEYNSPSPQFFPGSTVVPFSPETEGALAMRTGQAVDPNSLVNMAGAETGKTMRGEYLQPDNPVFRGMMTGISREVAPGVDTAFSRSGRFGSPLHAEAMSRGITQGMLPYVQAERGRQYQASLDAGTTSQYAPELLSSVGRSRESMGEAQLQERIDRHNFEQEKNAKKIREYMTAVSGGDFGTINASTSSPVYSNKGQTGAGLLSGGGSLLGGLGSFNRS